MDFNGVYPYGNFRNYYNLRKLRPLVTREGEEDGSQSHPSFTLTTPSTTASSGPLDSDLKGGRRTNLDPRVAALMEWFQSYNLDQLSQGEKELLPGQFKLDRVLDIGTNSGKVSIELAHILCPNPSLVMGIDLDSDLISDANFSLRGKWSTWRPRDSNRASEGRDTTTLSQDQADNNKSPQETKALQEEKTFSWPREADYFPSSFPSLFGALPLPPPDLKEHRFPYNVRFLTVDWMKEIQAMDLGSVAQPFRVNQDRIRDASSLEMRVENQKGWDLILGLSITKWLHLHHRDVGIRKFFASIATLLSPGGIFVLERQRIESYSSSRRALAKGGFHLDSNGLKLHPDDFDLLLTGELGLIGPIRVGEIEGNGFIRPLDIFFQPLKPPSKSVLDFRRACLNAPAAKPKPRFQPLALDSPPAESLNGSKEGSGLEREETGQNGEQVSVPWVKRKWKVK